MKLKKVLFILSGNLTTTPRAVKVIKMLSENGFECDVVLVSRQLEWEKKDRQIIENNSLKSVNLQLGRRPFFPWLKTAIRQKLGALMYKISKVNIDVTAYASNKSSIILWQYVKSGNYSGYMGILGHGAGSLYPSIKLGQKWSIPVMFDVEDYHPGEFIGKDSVDEKQRREFMMKKLLPKAMAITYASPLIGNYTLNLVGERNIDRHLLINNSFYANEFYQSTPAPLVDETLLKQKANVVQVVSNGDAHIKHKLKLVWFSQNVDFGRGLEDILPRLDTFGDRIELHLIGIVKDQFRSEMLDGRTYIKLHGLLTQEVLHRRLSEFDVGLALERKDRDLNRNLCLTNKIWAYIQAGLYVIATNTTAQLELLTELPWAGITFSSFADMEHQISKLLNELVRIRFDAKSRFIKAQDLSWEKEGKKLLELISEFNLS